MYRIFNLTISFYRPTSLAFERYKYKHNMASTYAVTEPEPATTHEETPTEHQEALEKKGHKEWGKLKMAVKVEGRYFNLFLSLSAAAIAAILNNVLTFHSLFLLIIH